MANLQRSTVFGVKEETTAGTPVELAAASEFIPLRTGFTVESSIEELTSDEILNDLGETKSLTGKETPSGTHGVYLKHSETEGQAPEYGVMIESVLGDKSEAAAEYNTVAGSTTSVINVDTGEGATYELGEALLVKDGTNGYSIRNISSISSDALTTNFVLSNAPGTGVDLGQAILYKPATQNIPTFTSWVYRSSGAATEMVAGCKVNSMSIDLVAGQQAEAEFSYEGTSYYFNPIVIGATNKYIDITDDGGTVAVTLTEGIYKDPVALATHITTVGTTALAASGGDDFTCTYDSQTGQYTLATTTGTVFSILWNSGANSANSVGSTLGFTVTADDTGALSYTSDSAISFAPPYTPEYDNADNVVVKNAELFIGDAADNICRKASTINITVDSPSVDSDSICAESGLFEKVATSRTVTMTSTLILDKYESHLFNKFINNTTTQAMVNFGPKSAGNWIPGKCVNIYFGNATITGHVLGGDDFVTVELTVKGFVTTTKKDFYINFI